MGYAIPYILQKQIALDNGMLSWENNQHVVKPPLVLIPAKWHLRNDYRYKLHIDEVSLARSA